MNDRPHAAHRPPRAGDQESRSDGPPTLLGQIYPQDDILAVVEDEASGERLLQSLRQVGIPDDDMDLIDAAQFVAAGERYESDRGLVERIAGWFSDERNYIKEYHDEARAGRSILIVHAADNATLERVRPVLVAGGARHMRHYREHTVEHLAAGDSSWSSGRDD